MSKKKQQKNGFFYFMLDMQQDLRERGRNVPIRSMAAIAGPKWASLPDAQKQAYNQRAKNEKAGVRGGGGAGLMSHLGREVPRYERMDCTGQKLSERRDLVAEKEERRGKEKELIRASFQRGKDVCLQSFYFIDFQSLFEVPDRDDIRFLPCEVAIVEYSLHSGHCKHLHKFIDPGRIPMGYRSLAMSTSERTHQIPVEKFERAESDYRMILADLEQFVSDGSRGDLPPVFAKRGNAERVEWCLQWLADHAGVENRFNKVYELEALMCELSGHLDGKYTSIYKAADQLNTSAYDYEQGIKCSYHDDLDLVYCSLRECNIYCFVVSEALCPKFGVSLTVKHLPRGTTPLGGRFTAHKPNLQPWMSGTPPTSISAPPPTHSLPNIGQLSLGRGRGYGAGKIRQPSTVGGLQSRGESM